MAFVVQFMSSTNNAGRGQFFAKKCLTDNRKSWSIVVRGKILAKKSLSPALHYAMLGFLKGNYARIFI